MGLLASHQSHKKTKKKLVCDVVYKYLADGCEITANLMQLIYMCVFSDKAYTHMGFFNVHV